jgi:hypothetical protein
MSVLADAVVWRSPELFSKSSHCAEGKILMPLRQSKWFGRLAKGLDFCGRHPITSIERQSTIPASSAQIRSRYLYFPADVTNRTPI